MKIIKILLSLMISISCTSTKLKKDLPKSIFNVESIVCYNKPIIFQEKNLNKLIIQDDIYLFNIENENIQQKQRHCLIQEKNLISQIQSEMNNQKYLIKCNFDNLFEIIADNLIKTGDFNNYMTFENKKSIYYLPRDYCSVYFSK